MTNYARLATYAMNLWTKVLDNEEKVFWGSMEEFIDYWLEEENPLHD